MRNERVRSIPFVTDWLLPTDSFLGSFELKIPEKRHATLGCILFNLYQAWIFSHLTGQTFGVPFPLDKNWYTGKSKSEYEHLSYRYMHDLLELLQEHKAVEIKEPGHFDKTKGSGKVSRFGLSPKLTTFFEDTSSTLVPINVARVIPVTVKDGDKQLPPFTTVRFQRQVDRLRNFNRVNTGENRITISAMPVQEYAETKYGVVLPPKLRRIHEDDYGDVTAATIDTLLTQYKTVSEQWNYRLLIRILLLADDSTGICDVSPMWSLTRKFNLGRLNAGGRFYADLSYLPSSLRPHLQINDEPTVELDYSAHHPRILYSWEKIRCEGDPYTIPGSRLERDVAKEVFQRLFNDVSRATTIEDAVVNKTYSVEQLVSDGKITLPEGLHAGDALMEVVEHFWPLQERLCSAAWDELQFEDSEIAWGVMKHFSRKGEACLPVHDSFIVRRSLKEELRRVMEAVWAKRHPNTPCLIKEKL